MCPIYHFLKDVLEDLKKAIQDGDLESFNQRLSLVEEFFQDRESTVGGLATSGALCYAARVGSIPMMDILIKKGVGKPLLQDVTYAPSMNVFSVIFSRGIPREFSMGFQKPPFRDGKSTTVCNSWLLP